MSNQTAKQNQNVVDQKQSAMNDMVSEKLAAAIAAGVDPKTKQPLMDGQGLAESRTGEIYVVDTSPLKPEEIQILKDKIFDKAKFDALLKDPGEARRYAKWFVRQTKLASDAQVKKLTTLGIHHSVSSTWTMDFASKKIYELTRGQADYSKAE